MRSMRSGAALWGTLVLAGGFEVATVLATQDRTVRSRSPWQDDPYNTVVSFALVAVPVLALLLGARMLARAIAGRPPEKAAHDQMARVACAATVIVGVVAGSEWSAVLDGAHRSEWNGVTVALIAGLAAVTLAVAVLMVIHVRAGALLGTRSWDSDWLDDLSMVAARLPGGGRRDLTGLIAWTRRRALIVFALGSMVGAAVVVGGMTYGEHWTDPGLIAWAFVVEATSNLFICLIGNVIAGFVLRPPPRRPDLEVALAVACLAVQLAVAFHAQMWSGLTGHGPNDVWALTQLTGGAALVGAVAAYPLSARRRRRRHREIGACG